MNMKTAALYGLVAGCFALTSCETEVVGPGADAQFRRVDNTDAPTAQLQTYEGQINAYEEETLGDEFLNEASAIMHSYDQPHERQELHD